MKRKNMNKKGSSVGWIITGLVFILIVLFFIPLINSLYKGYKFNKDIGDYCKLSYDASDIDKKIEYFDICHKKLHKENLKGYSVWWFKKPSNKLSELYEVADSLKTRMHNLKGMDKASFEYQKGLEQVEEEIAYFIGRSDTSGDIISSEPLDKFKNAYCFKYSFTKYIC